MRRVAGWLMRLALRLGARAPARVMVQLRIDGREMLRVTDREAETLAIFEGGQLKREFRVVGAVPVAVALTALVRP